ncbi:MAG TPA: BBP7 family outer membrane beta-barrel protein [Gemmataceae bacterium]|nr:BBP7 family outer membrane beta-barrel protein [Gemmataceae bacterium]
MVRPWIPVLALLAALGAPAAGGESKAPDSAWRPTQSSPAAGGAATANSPCDPGRAPVEPVPATLTDVGPGPAAQDWFWVRADYLGWWLTGSRLPPLVTAGPPGTPRPQAGVLGAPGTQVLFGDERVHDDYRSGVRITVGGWLDECRTTGFEVRALVLDRSADRFIAGSPDGSLVVSRPFVDARTGNQAAELVSFPGVLAGAAIGAAESAKFWAVDAVCRKSYCRDCMGYVDVLAGYRYLQFGDRVRMIEELAPLELPGSQINLVDEFNASNRFHGGVVGLAAGYTAGAMSVELRANVAVGETSSTVAVNGATRIATPLTGSATFPGGLLAQRTNIGVYRSSDWTVVPDLELTVACWLTRSCRVMAGYSVIYWPGVVRAGEQIDLALNPTQLPPGTLVGPARPAFVLHSSDLWAHGFSVGVEFRY